MDANDASSLLRVRSAIMQFLTKYQDVAVSIDGKFDPELVFGTLLNIFQKVHSNSSLLQIFCSEHLSHLRLF